jgi:ABC-type lipoprotein export system ATPase subunit
MPEIVLQATGLAKAFAAPAGLLPVLTAVSLEVRAGESVSIRGSSGSGKTTLLQLLGGLDVPDAGEVRVRVRELGHVADGDDVGGEELGFCVRV